MIHTRGQRGKGTERIVQTGQVYLTTLPEQIRFGGKKAEGQAGCGGRDGVPERGIVRVGTAVQEIARAEKTEEKREQEGGEG